MLKNGGQLWAANVQYNSYGGLGTQSFSDQNLSLNAGDTIDFHVGYGTGGNGQEPGGHSSYACDSTGLSAQVNNIDQTPPTTSFVSFSGTPGQNGWYTSGGAVTLSATDPDAASDVASTYYAVDTPACAPSSLGSCSTYNGPFTIGTDGVHIVTFFSQDKAGNLEAANTVTIKIDQTKPTISVAGATTADGKAYTAGTWTNQAVTVSFNCTDSGSGLAPGSPPADTRLSSDGTTPSVSGTCTDNAGNSASASFGPINIDKTKPTISASAPSPAANANSWNNTDVSVTFNCTDNSGGSGLDVNTVGKDTLSSEAANQSLTNSGSCIDKAGNVADAVTVDGISIDKTAPMISGAPDRAANANHWYNAAVAVSFSCAMARAVLRCNIWRCMIVD